MMGIILIVRNRTTNERCNVEWGGAIITLALGLQQRQGFANVRGKSEAHESHFMFPGVWERVRE
jgi:hypothetical protein